MAKVFLDAGAVLVLLQSLPGHEEVRRALQEEECFITATSLADAAGKLLPHLKKMEKVKRLLDIPSLGIFPLSEDHAFKAAELAQGVKGDNLSLADRLCLASAILEGANVLTANPDLVKVRAIAGSIRCVVPQAAMKVEKR